jgi:hypothetical protein
LPLGTEVFFYLFLLVVEGGGNVSNYTTNIKIEKGHFKNPTSLMHLKSVLLLVLGFTLY